MSKLTESSLISIEDLRAALAELVATLLFVFVIVGTVVMTGRLTGGELTAARLVAIALAGGLVIAVLVSATANLSGGHINPAVTFAALVTRKIGLVRGLLYVAAQLGGAAAGAALVMAAVPGDEGQLGATLLGAGVGPGPGVLVEGILTFLLVFVIFATAINPRGPGAIAPIAIGLTIVADHLVGVSLSGASMNPARSFGPALVAGEWADHWIYWVGPLAGGGLAALVYQWVYLRQAGES